MLLSLNAGNYRQIGDSTFYAISCRKHETSVLIKETLDVHMRIYVEMLIILSKTT